jgi:oligopeptide transport system substrate-binding protein
MNNIFKWFKMAKNLFFYNKYKVFFIVLIWLYTGNMAFAQKVYQRDELTRFSGGKPYTFDPTNSDDSATNLVLQDLFEGLTRIDQNGKVILALASSYKVTNNKKTYTFKIKTDAKWSDGSKVTAAHCALPIQRIVNPKILTTIGFSSYPILNSQKILEGKMPIQKLGVQIIDSETLQIKLSQPFPRFLELLSGINYVCLNPKDFNSKGLFINEIPSLSNSAYKIKDYLKEKFIRFEKNPYYYNFNNVKINNVIYYFTEDILSQINMYITGQADMTSPNISSNEIPYLNSKLLDNQLILNRTADSILLILNISKKPFKNKLKLRKSISMVINRDEIAKKILYDSKLIIYDIVPDYIYEYTPYIPKWATVSYVERVKEAKKLFNESGFNENNKLTIKINYNYSPDSYKIVESISEQLKKELGITVILNRLDYNDNVISIREANFEISLITWNPNYLDPIEYLGLLKSTKHYKFSYMNNPKYDNLLDMATSQVENKKRNILFEKAAAIGMEYYSVIPLFDKLSRYLVNSDIGGYKENDPYLKLYSQDLYFKKITIK